MALYVNVKDGTLEVREEMPSFDGTHVCFWYHDLANRVSSSGGRQGDELDRPMDDEALAWIERHYLPRLTPAHLQIAMECMSSASVRDSRPVLQEA